MNVAFDAIVALPCAAVGIRLRDDRVAGVSFLPPGTPEHAPVHPVALRACAQIRAYAADPASPFDLPLHVEGTAFRRRVWQAVAGIPPGDTRTYADLAALAGGTARAVGQACGDNPLPLLVPCHRVVAARGLGGFAHRSDAATTDVKRWLLAHEGRAAFALR